jgi:lipopolysaccharide biosynthesis regulator YciM
MRGSSINTIKKSMLGLSALQDNDDYRCTVCFAYNDDSIFSNCYACNNTGVAAIPWGELND